MQASADLEAQEAAPLEGSALRSRGAAPPRLRAERVLRLTRVVSDLQRAEDFYSRALDCRAVARGFVDPDQLWALGARYVTARQVVMRLGDEELALVQFASPGRPYPADSRTDDLWFQCPGIVVRDMEAAHEHLCRQAGWTPISAPGPQTLPPASGSLRAFKFRDPDGHPLQLLRFPPSGGGERWHFRVREPSAEQFLGIDHAGFTVRSTRASLGFYRLLGLRLGQRLLGRGPGQAHLDGLPQARVRITRLHPSAESGPSIELHAYRPPGRALTVSAANDVASEWVSLAFGADDRAERGPEARTASTPRRPVALKDPDGHRLLLLDHRASAVA